MLFIRCEMFSAKYPDKMLIMEQKMYFQQNKFLRSFTYRYIDQVGAIVRVS